MPQRNVASNFTFEQQRVEINELAADFWTQKGVTDAAAASYLLKDGSNAFTGGTLAVPAAFTINSNSGGGTVTIAGNLDVTGTTTTVSSANLEVTDKNILIAKGSTSDAQADGAGITIDSATDITWNFVDADDAWVSSIGVKAIGGFTGNLTGSATKVNITDHTNTSEENHIVFIEDAQGAGSRGLESDSTLTYNPSTGKLTATQLGGTLQTAAQPNITSVGTLTGLTVDAGANATIDFGDTDSGTVAFGRLYADNTGTFIGSKSNHDLILRTNNVETTRIDVDGKLVHKCNKASGYIAEFHQEHADNPGTILIDGPSDGNIRPTAIELAQAGSVKWGIGQVYASTSSQAFHICSGAATEANSKLTITTGGNVGIGTNNPGAALTVTGGGGAGAFIYSAGATNGGVLDLRNTQTSNYTWRLAVGGGDNAYVQGRGFFIRDENASATRFTINDGRVGINKVNPQRALDVVTLNNENGFCLDTIGTAPNYQFDIRDDGVVQLRVDPAGKVGIGTDSPSQMLEINGGSSPCVLVKDTTNDVIAYLFADDSNAFVGSASNHPVIIKQNNGTAATIDTNKNATFAGDVSDSKGSLRNLPRNEKSVAYTAVTADKGKFLSVNSNVTFDNSATWNTGDAVTVYNWGGSPITIVSGTGVLIHYTDGTTASTGNRTLASRGVCTLLCVEGSNNTFVISGTLT